MRSVVAVLLLATALAGCSGGGGGTSTVVGQKQDLQSGKGGISGLLINDVYRPIVGGKILLLPTGQTVITDNVGQFTFTDLEPGTYTMKMDAEGNEAAPRSIDVAAGQYTEVEFAARRISSVGSRIITTQYSVFIPCAVDYVANGNVLDCTGDTSGDSFRATFRSDYSPYGDNVTYLVTEMKANQNDRYEVQLRYDNGGNYVYLSVSQFSGDYTKMVMVFNGTSEQSAPMSYGENQVWKNDRSDLDTILFSDSVGREELQNAGVPVCCGAGVHLAIKANFVQSLFLGPPKDPIADYAVLA
jgi:hypothetical protein